MEKLQEALHSAAQAWADHAYLRSVRECKDRNCEVYTVEDALIACMANLWALDNLEEA